MLSPSLYDDQPGGHCAGGEGGGDEEMQSSTSSGDGHCGTDADTHHTSLPDELSSYLRTFDRVFEVLMDFLGLLESHVRR